MQMGDKDYWVRSFINPLIQMGLFDHHIRERSHHVRADRKAWVLMFSSGWMSEILKFGSVGGKYLSIVTKYSNSSISLAYLHLT